MIITVDTLKKHGVPKATVNIFAGIFPKGTDTQRADFVRLLQDNGRGVFWFVHGVGPEMLRQDCQDKLVQACNSRAKQVSNIEAEFCEQVRSAIEDFFERLE